MRFIQSVRNSFSFRSDTSVILPHHKGSDSNGHGNAAMLILQHIDQESCRGTVSVLADFTNLGFYFQRHWWPLESPWLCSGEFQYFLIRGTQNNFLTDGLFNFRESSRDNMKSEFHSLTNANGLSTFLGVRHFNDFRCCVVLVRRISFIGSDDSDMFLLQGLCHPVVSYRPFRKDGRSMIEVISSVMRGYMRSSRTLDSDI